MRIKYGKQRNSKFKNYSREKGKKIASKKDRQKTDKPKED